jgi:hypothetical protein
MTEVLADRVGKAMRVEPRAYLREATLQAVRNPGTATLPRDLKSPHS